ncbi:multidrug effflux MFS transporter [Sphingomonas sp. RG327]|jgi:DHA1 family bicyclomycin/chloramphenicol resistance-like MFS transporter|uniref:Multidrug effflux MFS transporter n=1 Tax=Sphingomonas anseongensis TaxID=2908207 RepID=A0ABT0RE22_9SPHN|nr:multidrug effflux MFS transporter [Sphingomonas anseongensis]MCL6678535.1 multidrug effflux MFS transporter [Sphingomonas anseongensis]
MFDSMAQDGVKRPGTREMTAMLAGLMALNALAIDAMIPALPNIGRSLDVAAENDRQLVVIAYFIGFASTQLFWGPLADRFGRKPILATGVTLYGIFALLCAFAGSFPLLIAGRVAMGASAAVTRVLVVAMVRDLFEAEAMARVMSLVFMVFMLVPVLAPNIGQLILLFAPWRAIFVMLAAYAVVMLTWSWIRLPETLHPEFRRSLNWKPILAAAWETMREPQSRGYTLAMMVSFSALVAYISSIQQIVFDAFDEGRFIGFVFASIAAPMALASYLNSRFVGRFGLRRVGHTAALAFMLVTAAHAAVALAGFETLAVFMALQALTMACFAFTSSNLGTLAMEHMAPIAGTASSVQGVVGTIGAAAIGFLIGQQFDGSAVPFLVGTALCAAGGFALIVVTEPRRLFAAIQKREEPPCLPEDLG